MKMLSAKRRAELEVEEDYQMWMRKAVEGAKGRRKPHPQTRCEGR